MVCPLLLFRWLKPLTTEVARHLLIPVAYAPAIIAVALMALEYAASTIDIMVSAVGFYFNKMRDEAGAPWKPPHEEPNFKATLEGIKRDIGTRKRKQPRWKPTIWQPYWR